MCSSGYRLIQNKCVIYTPPKFLFISKSIPYSIKGADLEYGYDTMIPITKIGLPKALEYDAADNALFYADSLSMTINMVPVNDTVNITVLVNNTVCDGLSFDWISRNLYYTSMERGSIGVVKLSNNTIVRTLIQSNNLSPRSIAVDPTRGVMYWADWSNMSPDKGHIDTAFMNGRNRTIFVSHDVHWPTGLTIDFEARRLYWCDKHLKKVESVDFNGGTRKTELSEGLNVPMSLTLDFRDGERVFYLIDKGILMKYSEKTGLVPQNKYYQGNPLFYNLKIFDNSSQQCKKLIC